MDLRAGPRAVAGRYHEEAWSWTGGFVGNVVNSAVAARSCARSRGRARSGARSGSESRGGVTGSVIGADVGHDLGKAVDALTPASITEAAVQALGSQQDKQMYYGTRGAERGEPARIWPL